MASPTAIVDEAWERYANRIREAGELIRGPGFPDDPRLRAEGYRYVARLASQAHYLFVEFGDTARPTLFARGGDVTAYGATNVDNNYSRCMVDPAGVYRVTGDVAGVRDLLLSVHEGEFVLGRPAVLAEAALVDLEATDGRLDLVLGGEERPTNWMPLAQGATYFNIRQFVKDWEHDPIATLHIERLDPVGPPTDVGPEMVAAGLERAATWVEANVRVWNTYSDALRDHTPVNGFGPPRSAEGGALRMLHGGCLWHLDEDQALVIEIEPAGATYWSIQNYVLHWLQPLDFVNRVTSLNDAQVRVDDDGLVRLVLAGRDPGVANWLDTSGLAEGLCSARWVGAAQQPTITARLVPLSRVREHLPRPTPAFSAAERADQVAGRRRGASRRFRR